MDTEYEKSYLRVVALNVARSVRSKFDHDSAFPRRKLLHICHASYRQDSECLVDYPKITKRSQEPQP